MPRPTKFLGSAISGAAAYGAGAALAHPLGPILQDETNAAWERHPSKPIGAGVLAEGVSQGQVPYEWALAEAKRTGINKERFDALVNVANVGPGVSAAFELWRRDLITETGFRRALRRVGLESEWIDDLVKLKQDVLDQAQLAAAIHRGLIPDPGLLKGETPGPDRTVEAYPVYPVDALSEAEANGYDRDHLGVLVGLQGLPMGPHEAAEAYFRGIITRDDYIAALNQGNTRNEWGEAILEQTRQIPTARDFFENALRGYHEFEWALDQAKRHGMSEADATIIYQNAGRPMAVRQITQALARGGKFKPEPGELKDPYEAAIVEGNLKPAYYDLAKSLRYTYPSAFALRGLVEQGAITTAEAEQVLLYEGWEPTFAAKVAKAWGDAGGGAQKEATATDLLTLYEAGKTTEAETLAALQALGYPADEAQRKLDVYDARRVTSEKTRVITAAHKAFVDGNLKPPEADNLLADLGVAEWARAAMLKVWGLQTEFDV